MRIGFNALDHVDGLVPDLNIHTASTPTPCLSSPPLSLPLPSSRPRLVGVGIARKPLAAALERLVITRQHGSAASYSYGIRRRKPHKSPWLITEIRNLHMIALELGRRRRLGGKRRISICLIQPACPVEKPWENQPVWPASPSAAVSMRKYGWPGSPGLGPGQGLASQEMPAHLSINNVPPPQLKLPLPSAASLIDLEPARVVPFRIRRGENNEMDLRTSYHHMHTRHSRQSPKLTMAPHC